MVSYRITTDFRIDLVTTIAMVVIDYYSMQLLSITITIRLIN